MALSNRLNAVRYAVDEVPHIAVDGAKCWECEGHPCLTFCPAHCFTPNGRGGIDYYYVGCVECGTCLLLCKEEAVRWTYPRGGHGVQYRF